MIRRLEHPCIEITCDGCGIGDNPEYETPFHHDTEATALESVHDQEWVVNRDENGAVTSVLCAECVEAGDGEEAP